MGFKALIIDDDPVMCNLIEGYCKQVERISSTIKVNNGNDALVLVNTNQYDLIFLDLNIPDITGKEILKFVPEDIPVILITSDPGFALESYEYNVVSYLVKPVTFSDFFKAVKKLKPPSKSIDQFFVKDGNQLVNIRLEELQFIKSESNYVVFYLTTGKVMSLMKMKDLETSMLPNNFMRVHRSYIVNIRLIDQATQSHVMVAGQKIPISESYRDALYKKLNY